MADPFVAEIRAFPFNFAPVGWALCNGQLMAISQNTALFSLLGTTYGGDGRSTFALPNLQGCVVVGPGQGPGLSSYDLGQSGGEANHALLQTEMPAHTHQLSLQTNTNNPTSTPTSGATLIDPGGKQFTPTDSHNVALDPSSTTPTGGTQPHNNMMPYLVMNYCIALQGIYPARS